MGSCTTCTGSSFRLNIPVIVFCIGWCALFIALSTECLEEKLEVARERGERIVDIRSVYNYVLFYPVIVVTSAGVMCYLAVSWRRIKRFLGTALMSAKIAALGPRLSRCTDVRLWGRILICSEALDSLLMRPFIYMWSLSMWKRGFTPREMNAARRNLFLKEKVEVDLDPADEIAIPFYTYGSIAVIAWGIVVQLVFVLVSTILIWHTMKRLQDRRVDASHLRKVRITLWQQLAGIWLIVVTTSLQNLASIWQTMNFWAILGWEEEMQPSPHPLAFLIDGVCDVLGILLLSGILGLLFREQADGGDISAHIRGLLHSAVLTSRGETVFEGQVVSTPSNICMVSFPGKYWTEWNELTWFCERGELSSACVFLPETDPHRRFGRHEENPDTPGQCWCHSMYGESKPWGCAWFTAWMANVEMAVRMKLQLVVVFFPNETNQGKVAWEHLTNSNLWDGVGLGGSQKVEVAWLAFKGYAFSSEDITETKRRFDRQRQGATSPSTASPGSHSRTSRRSFGLGGGGGGGATPGGGGGGSASSGSSRRWRLFTS